MSLVRPRVSPAAITEDPPDGPLAEGVRAGPGLVGYLGDTGDLTVLNPGDTPPGGWTANWDGNALEVHAASVTIDHYQINGQVILLGTNPTMTDCVVSPQSQAIYGVTLNGAGKGVLTITDTTVIGYSNVGLGQYMGNGISSDSELVARRCDVSGTGDGIHAVAADGSGSLISQCCIHDQAFIDEEQHCDGIQIFNGPGGSMTIEHGYVARTISTESTPLNSALTCGTPASDSTPLATMTIVNNFFESGLYHLRINWRLTGVTVTDNSLGTLHAGEFDLVSYEEPAAITSWSNNRDGAGNLIPQPT